jgi:hypothetical protein
MGVGQALPLQLLVLQACKERDEPSRMLPGLLEARVCVGAVRQFGLRSRFDFAQRP